MSHREISADGSIRLATEGCSFVFTRLRPGVVLVTVTGRDTGELGDAPLDELRAEITRYPPVDLYIDTRHATFAATRVSDAWTRFFSAHQDRLQRVRILVASRFVHLVVEVAKLFSRTGELIQVDADASRFDEAIAREAPAATRSRPRSPEPREGQAPAGDAARAAPEVVVAEAPRAAIRREIAGDGTLRIANDRCTYEVRRLRPGVVLMTIAGRDGGEFGEIPLDELRAEIARFGPITLFIDLRDVTAAAPRVSEVWTAFFASGRDKIQRARILVGSKLIQLTVALSTEISRSEQLIHLHTDPRSFDEALAREALDPGGPAAPR